MSTMNGIQNTEYENSERAQKRRRKTLFACNPCRSRKTRCDGGRPHCTVCTARGVKCVYEPHQPTSQPSLAEISARLEILEKSNTGSESSKAPLANDAGQVLPGRHVETRPDQEMNLTFENGRSPGLGDLPRIDGHDEEDDAPTTEPCTEPERGKINWHVQPDNSTVDPVDSSNIAFLESVAQASNSIRQPKDSAVGEPGTDGSRSFGIFTSRESVLSWDAIAITLPERRLADDLLAKFWENIHPIFPVLHRPSMTEYYEQIWVANHEQNNSGSDCDKHSKLILHATLNILFAIGCQFSETVAPQQSLTMADTFYQRSKKLFRFDELDSPSLSVVQLLLLTGIYLQSTRYSYRCWNTIGFALRVAQGLGLHIDRSASAFESQKQREMRRRVWYICIMMDRYVSFTSTFGRPSILSRNWPVPVPLSIDDKVLSETGEGVQPVGVHSQLDGFVHSLGFFDLLGDVLKVFYTTAEARSRSDNGLETQPLSSLSKTLALNSRLDEFLNSLPHHLQLHSKINSTRSPRTGFELQALTLYYRSLYLRILLLRPYVLSSIRNKCSIDLPTNSLSASGLEQRVSVELIQLCLSTAHAIIDNLYNQILGSCHSTSWHAVYFTFAAATVIVAASLCPEVKTKASSDLLDKSWDKALEIFQYNSVQSLASHDALESLKTFRSQAAKFTSMQEPEQGAAGINSTLEELPDLSISNFPWDQYDVTELNFFDTIDIETFQSQTISSDLWN
ncbi:uncharacterized protein PAC_16166 [Phialocephala subalpina]|uniref:Zn(2)-C6 fungal-type domain-containing protein n=1 Tax=Phialocephala subalpina TaxID=576137 RepID=A0A1L7XMJ7_9HELO|nr:uncharacterized protein PAC_16166 [Phialocephala subalpina]